MRREVDACEEKGAGAPICQVQINSMNEGNGTCWSCDHRVGLLAAAAAASKTRLLAFKTRHLSKLKSVKLVKEN